MDSYTAFVDRILQVPVLETRIEEWAVESDALNLVTTDWKKRLQHSALYKAFKQDAKNLFTPIQDASYPYQKIQKDIDVSTKVIVAGICNVYDNSNSKYNNAPFAVTLQECDAFNMLTEVLTSDMTTFQRSESVKLNFQSCSAACQHCNKAVHVMTTNGVNIPFDGNHPCILNIELFNGKNLEKCFSQQLKGNMPNKFVAIMQVTLKSRYTFETDYKPFVRLGADALNMIAFPESNLMPQNDLNNLCLLKVPTTVVDQASGSKRQASVDEDDDEEEKLIEIQPPKKMALNSSWDEPDSYEAVEESLLLL